MKSHEFVVSWDIVTRNNQKRHYCRYFDNEHAARAFMAIKEAQPGIIKVTAREQLSDDKPLYIDENGNIHPGSVSIEVLRYIY